MTTDLVAFERNVVARPRTTAPAPRPPEPSTPPDRLLRGRTAARSARVDAVPVVARDGRLLGLVTAQHCVELIAGAPSVPPAGPLPA